MQKGWSDRRFIRSTDMEVFSTQAARAGPVTGVGSSSWSHGNSTWGAGDWDAAQRRDAVAPGAEDDEGDMFGDFEDVETGVSSPSGP